MGLCMIVDGLRRIQHEHGYLPEPEIGQLAERLDVPLHRLHEVISFFPHYRQSPPPAVCVHVCRDLACRLRGSALLREMLNDDARALGDASLIEVDDVSCLGRCDAAPAVLVELNRPGRHEVCRDAAGATGGAIVAGVRTLALAHIEGRPLPDVPIVRAPRPWWIDPYHGRERCATEPYSALRAFAAELREAGGPAARAAAGDKLIEMLRTAELRGMGGAGKPAVLKWSEARRIESDDKYVVCNADESEPATFKDRELLTHAPYLVIEGMALAALLTGANQGYVYIRHEYYEQIAIMESALEQARALGVIGPDVLGSGKPFSLEVFVSPGGYVCGEQGALLEAIEERRAEPRNRPPEPETNGLFDKPTVLNNVETFAWVPAISLRGAGWYVGAGASSAWYERRGKVGGRGMRFFSVCGDVARPGVFEVPIGLTLGNLITLAGGVRDGLPLKAVATSGPSGGFVPARITKRDVPPEAARVFPEGVDSIDLRDLPLDIDEFRAIGLMLGAGLVVYAEGADIVEQMLSASQFFRDESCGKCVPCRLGSEKVAGIAERIARRELDAGQLRETKALADELQGVLELTSICGLGMSVAKPLTTLLHSFAHELERNGEPIP